MLKCFSALIIFEILKKICIYLYNLQFLVSMSLPLKDAIITFMDEFVVNGHTIKETLSHLSLISREWERGGGGCQSNHSRVYHISGGLSSPEVQTHCIKRRNKSRRQEARTKPKDI